MGGDIDVITLSLAKKYTEESLEGVGALKGKDGVGISEIEKIKTEGLLDVYRINLTNGSYFDFSVKNGKDGSGAIETISVNGRILEPDALKNVEIPIPTTLPASDVYDWAKQSEKPIYTAEEVGADPKGSAEEARSYTDKKIQELIGTPPENLDTIYEIAQAIMENQSVIDSINEAIEKKVDKVEGMGLSSNNLTDELIEKWNAKSDFSGDYNDLKNIPQVLIKTDNAMSNTSENAVQNKVIKEYVDESVGVIKKYQKYVNTELDYAYLQTDLTSDLTLNVGTVIPFNKVIESKGIEIDSENYGIVLKAGKTYEILCDIYIDGTNSGYARFEIYDLINEKIISSFSKNSINGNVINSVTTGIAIISAKQDTIIQVKVATILNVKVSSKNERNNLTVKEINREIVIDPVEYVNEESGIEDTPVGHIISHMGTKAPKHYLVCDGAEYNIADYPYLAEHFKEDFGSYNYFGGDGVDTFSVPDLRGEFLRGEGENSHISEYDGFVLKEGSGDRVGEHQPATVFPNIKCYTNGTSGGSVCEYIDKNTQNNPTNYDSSIAKSGRVWAVPSATLGSSEISSSIIKITTRPTNTSVLYCIKHEPTYFMKATEVTYSYEERKVGTWLDGKPLYEKTVDFGSLPNTTEVYKPHEIENVDTIWIHDGFVYNPESRKDYDLLNYPNGNVSWHFSVSTTNIYSSTFSNRSSLSAIVTLRYTKTTD